MQICAQSADRVFFKELMGIFRNMQRAVASQQAVDIEQPANLYFGNFNAIEVSFFKSKQNAYHLLEECSFWFCV